MKWSVGIIVSVLATTLTSFGEAPPQRGDESDLPGTETTIGDIPALHVSTYDTEDPVEVGKETIYVVEIRSEGTGDCTGVKIKSAIPAEMMFVKADGPASSTFDDKTMEVVFEPVAVLRPGEKLICKIVCKAVKDGSAKHVVTLTYDQFAKPIIDEEGTSCYK